MIKKGNFLNDALKSKFTTSAILMALRFITIALLVSLLFEFHIQAGDFNNQSAVTDSIEISTSDNFITDIFSFKDCLRTQIDLNGPWQFSPSK